MTLPVPETAVGLIANGDSVRCNGVILAATGILAIHMHSANRKAKQGRLEIEGLQGFYYTL